MRIASHDAASLSGWVRNGSIRPGHTYIIEHHYFGGCMEQKFYHPVTLEPHADKLDKPAKPAAIRRLCALHGFRLSALRTNTGPFFSVSKLATGRLAFGSPDWTLEQWVYFIKELEHAGYPPSMPGPANTG